MTKAKIIKEISGKTGIERSKVEAIIEAFMASVKQHCINKEPISLRGFGNFIVKRRAAKLARNISKGTSMNLPAHYVPAFKPAKEFRKKVQKEVK